MADIKLVIDSSDLSLLNEELNDTEKKVSLTAKAAERDFRRLMRSIAPLETAQQKYNNQVKVLQKAQLAGVISSKQYADALRDVNAASTGATKGLGALSRQAHQTKNKMNASGMAMQQAGYQVGDFVVQVQSGTNAWVAAGQQLTQLTGVIGMMNPALIGVGAALGVAVPLITAFGAAWSRQKEATENAEKGLKGLDGRIQNIIKSLEEYDRKKLSISLDITPEELDVSQKIEQQEKTLKDAISERDRLRAEMEKSGVGRRAGFAQEMAAGIVSYLSGEEREPLDMKPIRDAEAAVAEATKLLTDLRNKQEEEVSDKARELREEAYQDAKKQQAELMFDEISAMEQIIKARKKKISEAAIAQRKEDAKVFEAVNTQQSNANIALEKANIAQLNQAGDLINARDREKQLVMKIAAAQVEAVGGTAAQQIEAGKLAEEILKIKHDMEDAALAAKIFEEAIKNASGSGRGVDPRKFMEESPIGWLTPEVLKKYKEFMAEQNKGKGKEPTTMEGPIKALERQIELSKALFGLEGDARREQEVYMQLKFQNQDADIKAKESQLRSLSELVAEEERRTRVFEEQREVQKEVADTIANSMGDALTSIVDGTKSVKDAFKDMARAIIAELYQIFVVKQITGMISSAIMGPAAAGGYFGPAGGVGGGSGATIAYADGGVVGSPTTFPMNGGRTGLMGEAGPEAIMPLKRGANGKLGVQAEGGAGDVVIHQNFNFQANGDESVKKIIAQAAPQIAQMTKSSIISDRRRGGQIKATFG